MKQLIADGWRNLRLAYYQLALRDINPRHPDVPYIVQRINDLRSSR